MKKFIQLAIPFIAAYMMLGMMISLERASSQAVAAPSPSMSEGAILVTTLEDELNIDGDCSLREAITAANKNTVVDTCLAGDDVITDTITFDVAGTITVTSQFSVTAGGPLMIDGGGLIVVSGWSSVRIFYINDGAEIFLNRLKISNGDAVYGGGIYNTGILTITGTSLFGNHAAEGGGIENYGELMIADSTISGNGVTCCGGGIMNFGELTMADSTLSNNYAYSSGGGIVNDGTMTVTKSTISYNFGRGGGGILNGGKVIISDSTLAGNTAYYGGAIGNDGTLMIINSTISGNSASIGSPIDNRDTLTITNSTISGNEAQYGSTIYNEGLLKVFNSIVSTSLSQGDCSGSTFDGGHNISSDNTCGFDPANDSMPNTDPLLGPLQDNGGLTWTHALLWGSPAIDAGDNAQCPPTDQRGITRSFDGNWDGLAVCDIGSSEVNELLYSPYSQFLPLIGKIH